jgi:hypothetical protein
LSGYSYSLDQYSILPKKPAIEQLKKWHLAGKLELTKWQFALPRGYPIKGG